MKRLVMLVDDDRAVMQYYRRAIEAIGLEVVQFYDPDGVADFMSGEHVRIPDAVVLDVMLPPGKRYIGRADVDHGLRTGLLLLRELREHFGQCPFIVLTNVDRAEVLRSFPSDVCVVNKSDMAPPDFADFLADTLKGKQ